MKTNIVLKCHEFTNVITDVEILRKLVLMFVGVALTTVTACSGTGFVGRDNANHTSSLMEQEQSAAVLEECRKIMKLAMAFYRQGGFTKAAELFLEAADKFQTLNARDEERNALINAAKMQLKASRRKAFLLTMARAKNFMPKFEMPTDEECFLINLSDQMNNKSFTYPMQSSWQVVFTENR